MEDASRYLEFAENTLKKAGAILLSYQQSYQIKKTKDKLEMDIATTADYAVEELIVKEIEEHFPGHSILTEETTGHDHESEYQWIIDPLDGTKEYVRNSPYYYTLLALRRNNNFICGVGYQPKIGRLLSAGNGEFIVDGFKTSLSQQTELSKSFVSVTLLMHSLEPAHLEAYLKLFGSLSHSCYRIRNTQWDVEALFNVAMGAVEAYIMPPQPPGWGPKPWDVAPGFAAVLANGGTITDFYNQPVDFGNNRKGIIATNGKVHEKLIGIVQSSYLANLSPA